jgi:hypothetical protein
MADLFVRGGSAPSAGVATITTAADCTGCDLLTVSVSYDPAADTLSGITYAGAAMTLVDSNTVGANVKVATYKKTGPATGSNNIVVTFTAAVNVTCMAGWQAFNGTDQTTPLGAAQKATGTSTSASVTLTSIGANNSGFDAVASAADESLPTQTQAYLDVSGTVTGAGSHAAGNATRTFTWTLSVSNVWASMAFEVNAAGGAAAQVPHVSPYQQILAQ